MECETLLTDFDSRNNFFDFVLPKYEEYAAEAARLDAEDAAKTAAEKLEKRREIKRLKAEKAMRKTAKVQAKTDKVKFTDEYFEQYKTAHAQELEEMSRLPEDAEAPARDGADGAGDAEKAPESAAFGKADEKAESENEDPEKKNVNDGGEDQ